MSGRVRGPGRSRVVDSGAAPWWPAADVAVLAAMVCVGSMLLVPTYGGSAPVVAAILGALISGASLYLVRRFRLPGWASVPLIVLGVVLLGSLLVAPRLAVLGFLPSFTGMGRVLRGVVDGWRELLTVATPTGVAGALLVPPLIIGAVGVALAGLLATTRRPTSALLVPAATLIIFALFGNGHTDALTIAVVAGTFVTAGVSWSVWVGSRTRRRTVSRAGDPTAAGSRGAGRSAEAVTRQALAARRVAISAVVLVLAVLIGAMAAGAAAPPRTALREVVELPTDPATFVSPLSTFRTYTKDQADAVQLSVSGLPAGARLRLAALDYYDGRQFTLSNGEGPFVRIGQQRPVTSIGDPATVRVVVENYTGLFLPLPGQIRELNFTGPGTTAHTEDLRYSEAAATGLMPAGWQRGDRYTVTAAVPPQPSAADLAAVATLPAPFPTTVALPDTLRAAANRYVLGVSGAAAQVEAIRAGLAASGTYSDGTADDARSPAGHGLNRMADMLDSGRLIGDEEQFAALLALMVRSIGLPARVVVGFVPSPAALSAAAGSADGAVQVLGADISAWVEVPFEGYGWVAFDPTPAPARATSTPDDRSSVERRTVGIDVPPALPQAQPDTAGADNTDQRPSGTDSDPSSVEGSGWIGVVLPILGWLLLVFAALAIPVGVILVAKLRRRRRRRSAGGPKEQITGGWQELIDVAVDSGYRPTPWHTRTEAAADLHASGVLLVDWLAPAADSAEFSPSPVDPEQARGYWREVDDRTGELLGGLPLWRRWRARLSPASLRPSAPRSSRK